MPRAWTALLLVPVVFFASRPCAAQSPRPSSSARNVMAGEVVSLDASAGTLSVRPKTGAQTDYRITDKTRCLRQKKAVEPGAFKAGDSVVVRYRKSSVGPPTLYDLADKPSWDWLDRIRHEAVQVTIREVADGWLKVTEGADAAEMEYRFTDKTRWARKGAEAAPSDFKPGEKVWVTPRLLPNGATMAVGVADTPEMAGRLKERARVTVTGTVKTVDAQKRTLSMLTAAGDDRSFVLAQDCVFRQSSKDVALAVLKTGQTVTVHLRRESDGEQVVRQVTIQTKKPARKPARTQP